MPSTPSRTIGCLKRFVIRMAVRRKPTTLLGIVASLTAILLLSLSLSNRNSIKNNRNNKELLQGKESSNKLNEPLAFRKNMYGLPKVDLWLSSAILDRTSDKTLVHIFGVQKKGFLKKDFECGWVYSNTKVSEKVSKGEHILIDPSWPQRSPMYSMRITCQVPSRKLPSHVFVRSVDKKIKFPFIPIDKYEHQGEKKKVGVCVKALSNSLSVIKLVEWFEILKAAGLKDFMIYQTDVHGASRFVFEYYKMLKELQVVDYPFFMTAMQRHHRERAFNDVEYYAMLQQLYLTSMQECLYRFKPSYEYLMFFDIDELILPTYDETIQEMLLRLEKLTNKKAGFIFQTAWHHEDYPPSKDPALKGFYMLKLVHCSKPGKKQPKYIANTELTDTLNFHGILRMHNSSSGTVDPYEFGYTHHFRGKCARKYGQDRCKKDILTLPHGIDPVMERFSKIIPNKVRDVLDKIQVT